MTTTKAKTATKATKQAGATASKKASKVPTPARAIGDAAVGLERDIATALRKELKNLKKTVETIQQDVHKAIGRVEDALDAVAKAKPSSNGAGAKKAAAKKTPAKKTAARKTAASKR